MKQGNYTGLIFNTLICNTCQLSPRSTYVDMYIQPPDNTWKTTEIYLDENMVETFGNR